LLNRVRRQPLAWFFAIVYGASAVALAVIGLPSLQDRPAPFSLAPLVAPRDAKRMTERRIVTLAAFCGIAGPLALTLYFAAPALTGWPYGGAPADQLLAYGKSHQTLFYAGAWLQATGTLLSIIFFLALVQLAGAMSRLSGLVVVVSSAALLSLVLVEAAFLVAVPQAAGAGDSATVATTFDLSNGVFVRVFPLAPASASYLALGAVILGSKVLPRAFGYLAVAIGVAFVAAGLVAIFSTIGVIVTIALSVGQELWIVAAAIQLRH
jgi:hypothetical protein